MTAGTGGAADGADMAVDAALGVAAPAPAVAEQLATYASGASAADAGMAVGTMVGSLRN